VFGWNLQKINDYVNESIHVNDYVWFYPFFLIPIHSRDFVVNKKKHKKVDMLYSKYSKMLWMSIVIKSIFNGDFEFRLQKGRFHLFSIKLSCNFGITTVEEFNPIAIWFGRNMWAIKHVEKISLAKSCDALLLLLLACEHFHIHPWYETEYNQVLDFTWKFVILGA